MRRESSAHDMRRDASSQAPQGPAGHPVVTSSTVVLVRATSVDRRVLDFADLLEAASGHDVVLVTDERHGPTPPCGRPVAGVSVEGCEALGLFCPPAFAWQCGDYGYYVARTLYPRATHFWLIEYDVRFSGDDLAGFFTFFAARPEIDFLTTYFGPADWDWFWAITARARDVRPTRCLFPITRLSARAIDAVLAKRIAHGRRPLRRALWPNDEAMVATTLLHGKYVCHDLNDFGALYYGDDTFSFTQPIDGDAFDADSVATRIYHPVLFGAQYALKVERLKQATTPRPYPREMWKRIAAKMNSWTAW